MILFTRGLADTFARNRCHTYRASRLIPPVLRSALISHIFLSFEHYFGISRYFIIMRHISIFISYKRALILL